MCARVETSKEESVFWAQAAEVDSRQGVSILGNHCSCKGQEELLMRSVWTWFGKKEPRNSMPKSGTSQVGLERKGIFSHSSEITSCQMWLCIRWQVFGINSVNMCYYYGCVTPCRSVSADNNKVNDWPSDGGTCLLS